MIFPSVSWQLLFHFHIVTKGLVLSWNDIIICIKHDNCNNIQTDQTWLHAEGPWNGEWTKLLFVLSKFNGWIKWDLVVVCAYEFSVSGIFFLKLLLRIFFCSLRKRLRMKNQGLSKVSATYPACNLRSICNRFLGNSSNDVKISHCEPQKSTPCCYIKKSRESPKQDLLINVWTKLLGNPL